MKFDLARVKFNKVLVVGDLLLDRYWIGDTNKISPEAPVPVVLVKDSFEKLGGAGNVAQNASSLGSDCCLMGEIGSDSDGDKFLALCDGTAIDTEILRNPRRKTIVKHRIVSQGQQLLRADFEPDLAETGSSALLDTFSKRVEDCDVIVISDYGKGGVKDAGRFIACAKEYGKKVLVDPKGEDFSRYIGADLVTPNLKEFETIVGKCDNPETMVLKARKMLLDYDLGSLLITRGCNGMTLVTKTDDYSFNARSQEVFDVTGAGDTVCAAIAALWVDQVALPVVCEVANVAAGIAVNKFGVATVTLEEVRGELTLYNSPISECFVTAGLDTLPALANVRSKGLKVVMTNGCFDILHTGHVRYLSEAKALGDILVVAINDNASVARLKGKDRPINDLHSRVQLLEALRCVDYVIPFSEDTPERLIARVSPDVLVKGGDYEVENIAGADFVLANGGEVKILSLIEGYSTSAVIDKLSRQFRRSGG
ncbi:MAG: bifunctional D-glycero-beta-D-manno-heptose-7-phosphate kinase/D-glycero-beta-D-manno-heptose 1-phosphate adenylyltransferase HldE [Gammaproteobacteria bacterium]